MISPEGPTEVHLIHSTPDGHQTFTGRLEDWTSIGLTVSSNGEGSVFFPWANVHHVREWRAEKAIPRKTPTQRADGSVDWDSALDLIERASGWT